MSGLFLAAWRLVLKRAASDRLIVAAAFLTVLLAAALLAAGPIYSEAVALSGLERTLADAPARDSGLEVSGRIPLADASGRTIMEVIRELVRSEGVSAIVATHDPLLLDIADRVVELRDGEAS